MLWNSAATGMAAQSSRTAPFKSKTEWLCLVESLEKACIFSAPIGSPKVAKASAFYSLLKDRMNGTDSTLTYARLGKRDTVTIET